MYAEKDIMAGYSECHWPGGQLRVSTPNFMAGGFRRSPKGYTMVVIRLARGGAKARPFFNIVVADKRTRRDGRFIERIGFYNPIAKGAEESIRIAQDRLTYWREVGAQASPTVERLINQAAKKAA
jgi:small subunit ribosomal protein S16